MITIVTPYFDNGGMLDRHFEEWHNYEPATKAAMRAVIVDDGSPNDPAADHWSDPGFPVEIYRIKQNLVWNVAGARNLGMHVAPAGWCLLTDIDHLLSAEDADLLIAQLPSMDPRCYYTLGRRWADGRPLHPHTNSYAMTSEIYWRCGGCDEDWTGHWGAGEQVFRKMLKKVANGIHLEAIELEHYGRDDIPDASTVSWGRRGSEYDWRNNPALVAKAGARPYKPENPLRFDWERLR